MVGISPDLIRSLDHAVSSLMLFAPFSQTPRKRKKKKIKDSPCLYSDSSTTSKHPGTHAT